MPLTIPADLKARIDKLEADLQPALDYEISTILGGFHRAEGLSEEERTGAWAEHAPFNFQEVEPGEESIWGTHFAPMTSRTAADGSTVYAPDIKEFNEEIVEHWELRACESPHPLLRARYADLVWDLKHRITGKRPNIRFAQIAVDSYVETIDRDLFKESFAGIRQSQRALEIAVRINDKERIERVRDAMFALHQKVASDTRNIGFLFDSLYGNKKVLLEPNQEAQLITSLEEHLVKHSNKDDSINFDTFAAQAAAERLAQHYERQGRPEELQRVIRKYGQAVEAISQDAGSLLALSWLQPVIETYRNRGMSDDMTRAQLLYAEKGANTSSEMKSVKVSTTLSHEELEMYFDAMTSGSAENTLARIAGQFIPMADQARKFLEDIRKNHPFFSLVDVERIAQGQIAARAGSIDSDPEGRLIFQLAENINHSWAFLSESMDRARTRHSLSIDDILDFLLKSPVFQADRRVLLAEGLSGFLNSDYTKAIHVLIPQIETALRELLRLVGVPVSKLHRNGTMQVKNLNDILREESIKTALGESLQLYMLVFLADPRGFNLRNDVCHGLMSADAFRKELADRVVHCLLTLGLIRKKAPKEE